MHVAYIGNFSALHSTENHVARALEANGHIVERCQEGPAVWSSLPGRLDATPDFVLWTHTHGLAPEQAHHDQAAFLARCRNAGIPTVAYHLDLWWGLDREPQVHVEPFFRCDLVCTADGGHDPQWEAIGVNHRWFPPAVSEAECAPGRPRREYRSDVAFVGSWAGGYHEESRHRYELVNWLRTTYGETCRFWPKPARHAVRGADLRDLYASVKVAVGDSCLVPRLSRYWSDRVPETVGRGALLLHPDVEGLTEQFKPGEHLDTWRAGDWDALRTLIDGYLADDDRRAAVAAAGRAHVLEHHTYEVRMRQLVDALTSDGLL